MSSLGLLWLFKKIKPPKKLLGTLFKPIKWMLAGLFAAGKLGARLVLKGVKAVDGTTKGYLITA